MRSCILIFVGLLIFGCGNEVSPPVDNTVHLAGYLGTPDLSTMASYWKDGKHTALTPDSVSTMCSMYVDGSSVVIAGTRREKIPNSNAYRTSAVYWTDGAETRIAGGYANVLMGSRNNNLFGAWIDEKLWWVYFKNGDIQKIADTVVNIGPNSLAIDGDDLYLAGSASGYFDQKQHAQYWKNGQLMFRESKVSNAMSIFIHGGDIYLGGYWIDPAAQSITACYWKNGERVDLGAGSGWSVFVTDEHVYVAGAVGYHAAYWRDGEVTVLPTEAPYSLARSICVREPDVHVGGSGGGYPLYWKNGVKQEFEHRNRRGEIRSVMVGSN